MAQIEFYFTDSERKDLFQFIKLKGGKIIPDIFFESEKFFFIKNSKEFLHIQKTKTTHFFLIDKKFALENLRVSQNRFIQEPKFAVNQRKGGPYIDLSFYRGYATDANILFMASTIDIYSKFIHINNHEEFEATGELKEYYQDIVKYIKSKSKLIKKNGKNYYVGNEALKEITQVF